MTKDSWLNNTSKYLLLLLLLLFLLPCYFYYYHDLTMYYTFGCPFSFESPENKAMWKKVLGEVQSVYGMEKWKKTVVTGKQ